MSVLIKGWEMPKSCGLCRFDDYGYCTMAEQYSGGSATHGRASFCPLVEVPEKHGDLIDRKVLSSAVLKWMPPDPCGKEEKEFPFEEDICVSMMMEIEEQPTIIEAEGEE